MVAYIALLRKDGRSDYSVEFPDLPGCITAGKSLDEAREFAREALTLHLKGLAEDGAAIPAPSGLDAVMSDPENRAKDTVAFLVEAPARKLRAVPVTITVAEDLLETVKAKSAEWGLTQSGVFSEGARKFIEEMSESKSFIAKMTDIAERGISESAKKELIVATIEQYVKRAKEFYAGERYPKARIQEWLGKLSYEIEGELRKRPEEALNFVLSCARRHAKEWARRH